MVPHYRAYLMLELYVTVGQELIIRSSVSFVSNVGVEPVVSVPRSFISHRGRIFNYTEGKLMAG